LSDDQAPADAPCEHCGIFTIPGPLTVQSAWRDITFEPIRNTIWTASEGIYRTIFVEGRRGLIAFDTFSTPGGARAYAGAMQRVFPRKPVHTIVYSHEHLDHTGYAADLAPDADILAHELCDTVIRARQSDGQLPATETFAGERQRYELDGVRFELLYPGPTHGDGNIAAFFPDSRVLFMVDTVIPGVGYTFFPDWHLLPYVPAMRRLLSLDWDVFVPGHFWVTDRKGFEDNLRYYDQMAEIAQEALATGVDPDDFTAVSAYARRHLDSRYGALFRFDEYCAMNLSRYMQHFLTGGWGIEGNMRIDPTPF
jgi:glyoxylase-like metal-dependent hydrolase (beta-lactamase superfamily II)